MKKGLWAFVFVLLAAAGAIAGEKTAEQVKAVVIENQRAIAAGELERMMETIHPDSPSFDSTREQVRPLIEAYRLNYRLLNYAYMGKDGEYAVARVLQRTSKVSGPAFRDNEIDMIQIFRQDRGRWKYWDQVILDVRFLN